MLLNSFLIKFWNIVYFERLNNRRLRFMNLRISNLRRILGDLNHGFGLYINVRQLKYRSFICNIFKYYPNENKKTKGSQIFFFFFLFFSLSIFIFIFFCFLFISLIWDNLGFCLYINVRQLKYMGFICNIFKENVRDSPHRFSWCSPSLI